MFIKKLCFPKQQKISEEWHCLHFTIFFNASLNRDTNFHTCFCIHFVATPNYVASGKTVLAPVQMRVKKVNDILVLL